MSPWVTLSYSGVTTRYKIEAREVSSFRGAARRVCVSALSLHEATIAADEVDLLEHRPRKPLPLRRAGLRTATPRFPGTARDRDHSRRKPRTAVLRSGSSEQVLDWRSI